MESHDVVWDAVNNAGRIADVRELPAIEIYGRERGSARARQILLEALLVYEPADRLASRLGVFRNGTTSRSVLV
jgi:hypothetical protein